ncbi:vitamin K epoxide reductase family protein [Dermabacteraceae bacterium P13088]
MRENGHGPAAGESITGEPSDAELLAAWRATRWPSEKSFGALLLVTSLVCLFASLMMAIHRYEQLLNPGAVFLCDLNPFISCGQVLKVWQSAVFGFPNTFLGLAGYGALSAWSVVLLSGIELPTWLRRGIVLGMLGAFTFVHFLIYTSLIKLQVLCPYCSLLWVMTGLQVFTVLAYSSGKPDTLMPRALRSVFFHRYLLFGIWLSAVVVAVILAFLPRWIALLGL